MIELTVAGEKFRFHDGDWTGPEGALLDLIRRRSEEWLAATPVSEPDLELHVAQQIAREAQADLVDLSGHEPPQADPGAIY